MAGPMAAAALAGVLAFQAPSPSWPPPSPAGASEGPCRFTLFVSGAPDGGGWAIYRDGAERPLARRDRRHEAEDEALEIALDLGRARVLFCVETRDGFIPETDAAYGCALPGGDPPACPTPPQ